MGVLGIFSFIFHFPFLFLCINHYSNFIIALLVILMAISDTRYIFRGIINPSSNLIGACFFEEIKVIHALLWDLKFSWNWGKKWALTNTTVGAYFSTIAQPFSFFRKLLAIIPRIQNHPHLRILKLKSILMLNHRCY